LFLTNEFLIQMDRLNFLFVHMHLILKCLVSDMARSGFKTRLSILVGRFQHHLHH